MKKRKRKTGGISLMFTVMLIAFLIVGVLCWTRWTEISERRERLEQERAQLEAQKQALIERNNSILAKGAHGNDAQYVEDVARNQLDMVYPGEIVFKVTGE